MGGWRKLTDAERALVIVLVSGKPGADRLITSLDTVMVEEMSDGGMGSLLFRSPDCGVRRFGRQIAEGRFTDVDGVPLVVTVTLDEIGELYELDIWKVDFSPLNQFPVARDDSL